ncbi:hypothetical protein PGT21_006572 [Puccinia graminis f. sp. tritici]|uniref:Uncharacterized protein n=2 Tax=Puccinia graminis f. sp. tritici TaxID=56615 RepID=H6QQZ1_PUCGT|nr:uncharacterized protein PGTG_21278 [Puccinia graminis f. sp. tritici CRL 75-36-700-3]EHS62928.1 hypothetical protein PGTG_21278 [Puccinia graminis f. sp. tritici CRL 75-36-700-3]KAA1111622.1 hypothetical protein PGT21_006572 [Puccinia graminis f. sp. tritici]KAA1123881.1 hypothetical protein PGTUg99_028265 [Puccinia graminis f. sp. tritici]
MQLYSILSGFYLLNSYVISAHPTLYPKGLEKREIEGPTVGTQVHSLHRRMEGTSQSNWQEFMTQAEFMSQEIRLAKEQHHTLKLSHQLIKDQTADWGRKVEKKYEKICPKDDNLSKQNQ